MGFWTVQCHGFFISKSNFIFNSEKKVSLLFLQKKGMTYGLETIEVQFTLIQTVIFRIIGSLMWTILHNMINQLLSTKFFYKPERNNSFILGILKVLHSLFSVNRITLHYRLKSKDS